MEINRERLTFAILGYGARGNVYSNIIKDNSDRMQVVAVCEPNLKKLESAAKKLNIKGDMCFTSSNQFFSCGKIADVLMVTTPDRLHFDYSIKAMEMGYDLLLEKPISIDERECVAICRAAKRLKRKVVVCHVLRYTPFYQKIKELIGSGNLGQPITISQTENVGYWHFAHSFVRGNWRNSELSSPMILQKCCHDLDIIKWLMGEKCCSVSSFGSLIHYKEENAPSGSGKHCFECKVQSKCPYDAIAFYKSKPDWRYMTGTYFGEGDDDSVEKCFSDYKNPYSRCVYRCDNNVVDHQVVNMLFDGGKTAQLTMTAFSKDFRRNIKVHCTNGEIVGDIADNTIIYTEYGKDPVYIDVKELCSDLSNHGGGDRMLMLDLYEYMVGSGKGKGLTEISNSLDSHLMAFAAEKSRILSGRVVKL